MAVNDRAVAVAGQSTRIAVLRNDSDPDGDRIRLVKVFRPTVGTATRSKSKVRFRAPSGFTGTVTVRYRIKDASGARDTARLRVLVRPSNQAPRAVDDPIVVRPGSSTRIAVLANDSDPDGDRIRLVKVFRPTVGTATKSKSKVRFLAPSGFTGTVTVRYRIKDAYGARDTARLRVSVQRPGTSPTRTAVESALARLGMPVGPADGSYDARTRRGVCAWRTVTGRTAHRGLPTAAEARAIVGSSGLPAPRSELVTGVTVSVTCQAAFWVSPARALLRVMPASTGTAGYRTRLGTHRIFVTYPGWTYSTIYRDARMYKLMQFSGGQGLHGSATDDMVKTYPASHGCVRMLHRDMDALQAAGVGNGTLVRVIGYW